MITSKNVAKATATRSGVAYTPVLPVESLEHEDYWEIRIPKVIKQSYVETGADKVDSRGNTVPSGYAFAKIQFPQVQVHCVGKDEDGKEFDFAWLSKPTNNFNLFFQMTDTKAS